MLPRKILRRRGFAPKPAYLRLLSAWLSGEGKSVKEVCGKAGVSTACYKRMLRDADARKWWLENITAATAGEKAVVYQALVDRASTGDPRAIQIWLERFDPDYCPRGKFDSIQHISLSKLTPWEERVINEEEAVEKATAERKHISALAAIRREADIAWEKREARQKQLSQGEAACGPLVEVEAKEAP